ncbi:methyltransferase domain-containing protein [Thalassobius sp. S69A]|uniref:methyltransferase domain-containing protein n=1 Tax=unclassified Thalassovita TaxID=2619711 RepID=UPI000C0F09F5|nr:trans-aconitate methyltransferase [Paracoccaceae bacterium]MBT27076.1 trans-aconitate methyltransferase [Paracoccaceae bacterium]
MADWNPGKYQRFADLRLRPALDLIAAIPALPEGNIVDLGCGAGAVAADLAEQFAGRDLVGVDSSATMLAKAQQLGLYARLDQADIALWRPCSSPALIYSNAALHWVPDHAALLPALVQSLPPGGVLAVQVPYQNPAPSHRTWVALAEQLFPGRVDMGKGPGILTPEAYFDILSPLGQPRIWQTEYLQRLTPVATGHPVRHFTESTFARPILTALEEPEQAALIHAYETAMAEAYPLRADGSVLFPFRRLFFTLQR